MDINFRRITTSGLFIPEIDGLRFIAISSVILFHLSNFLHANYLLENIFFRDLCKLFNTGYLGVELFFTISGFILAGPFARHYILQDGNNVSLVNYFKRRLTRLEPPYIIAMTLFLLASVFVAKKIAFNDGVISYFSSIFYLHNFIFPLELPFLNSPAWSLEIEVQFYILTPLLSLLFKVKSAFYRRSILVGIIFILSFINANIPMPFTSIIVFLHYFLIGFLLLDFKLVPLKTVIYPKYSKYIGILFFILIWFMDFANAKYGLQRFMLDLGLICSIFVFYYSALIVKDFKLITKPLVTNIGGMCYSIYLIHSPIIVAVTPLFLKHSFTNNLVVNTVITATLVILTILLISSVFFLLIERPCMDKFWVNKLFARISSMIMKKSVQS